MGNPTPSSPAPPTFSVVIPCYNAAATLAQTLQAVMKSNPPPCEVILVDDGSSDASVTIARAGGAQVLALKQNIGAAAAKNRGAAAARGDILIFTDSDIVVPPDWIARLARDFTEPTVDGVVGLLSTEIPYHNWASQFKNLWMRFTYARFAGQSRIGLFYTSIAAMRRATFVRLGGFDEEYRGASIAEDTEFGQRAWGQGVNLLLDPELEVVHLKRYTVRGVLREDFLRARALTMMRLRKRGQPFFTSVPVTYQLAVPVLYLALLAFLAALVTLSLPLFAAALVGLGVFMLLNFSLLAFVTRARGIGFGLKSALFLPADVFAVGLGMLKAGFDFLRGLRY